MIPYGSSQDSPLALLISLYELFSFIFSTASAVTSEKMHSNSNIFVDTADFLNNHPSFLHCMLVALSPLPQGNVLKTKLTFLPFQSAFPFSFSLSVNESINYLVIQLQNLAVTLGCSFLSSFFLPSHSAIQQVSIEHPVNASLWFSPLGYIVNKIE